MALARCCNLDPSNMTVEQVSQFMIYFMDSVISKLPAHHDQIVFIYDVSGFGYSNFSKDICKAIVTISSKLYTGNIKQQIVLNSSMTVKMLYNIGKAFMHERARRRFEFMGCNKEMNREYLLTKLDADVLPNDMGGHGLDTSEILERYASDAHEDHMQNLRNMNRAF